MPYSRPNLNRPLPRPARRRIPRKAAVLTGTPGSSIGQQLGAYNFVYRVYVAWDGATAANPSWIEVTQFVDQTTGIQITRGRPDGESQPQVGTCTMTVDNTDGRWSPSNPNGAWFGQIRKGAWLRVDILPPSGTVSRRFTGFIQQLPVGWSGRYSTVKISASDRFVLLGNAPQLQAAIAEEWLTDPAGAPYIVGYWPLHEAQGATYVSDISGLAPASQSTLTVRSQGVDFGSGLTFANTAAPGYDGLSTLTFAPSGTVIGASNGLPNGSYLQGVVGPMGYVAQITFWISTSTVNQPIMGWSDPATNYTLNLYVDGSGFFGLSQQPLSGTSSTIGFFTQNGISRYPIDDGVWHQVSIKIQAAGSPPGGPGTFSFANVSIDGISVLSTFFGTNAATAIVPPTTLSVLTVGAVPAWGTSWSAPALFTGSLSDLVVHLLPSGALNVDFYGPYQGGTQMWQSPNYAYPVAESCGRRIIRLAQYAGFPAPLESFTLPNFGAQQAYDVTPGTTPFINIPAETAHPAGLQQMSGQQPLSLMQAAAATENMPLFIDQQGRLTLQPSTLRQNPAVAFTIDGNDLDPSTAYADDFQYLQNQAVITPSGQGSLTVNTNGQASQQLYGLYSDSVSTITINALESGSLGAAANAAGSNPQARHNPLACEIATLAMQPGYGNTWYDAVLASEISSVLALVNMPSQTPGGSSGSYYIEGYTETITAGQHLFAWNTSAVQGATYQCDSATLGLCDTPGLTLAY